jgi:rhodanese-related sulfurtransferase
MRRRTFLTAGAVSLSAVAGCLGGGNDSNGSSGDGNPGNLDLSATDSDRDGVPPEFDEVPGEREIDVSSFGVTEEDGVEVPLAPIDVAHYWYKRREARFVDARSEDAYGKSHVYGAVSSPASSGMNSSSGDDPVADWPKDDRIVAYCGCPHHLSSMRASTLIQNGYENVLVIDEGFWEWHDRGYPMAGSNVDGTPEKWVISGETDAAYAGNDAWARHRPSGQMEATDIADGGTYELHLNFHEVGPNSVVEVETPGYTIEGKLKNLASGTIRG